MGRPRVALKTRRQFRRCGSGHAKKAGRQHRPVFHQYRLPLGFNEGSAAVRRCLSRRQVRFFAVRSKRGTRKSDEALAFHPAPMTPLQHVRYLKDRAGAFRLAALHSEDTAVSSVAQDLEERADEIGRENSLSRASGDGRR